MQKTTKRQLRLAVATLILVMPLFLAISLVTSYRRYPSLSEFLDRYSGPPVPRTPSDSHSQASIDHHHVLVEVHHVLVEVQYFLSAHSLPGSVPSIHYNKANDAYDIKIDLDGNVDQTNWGMGMTNDRTTGPKNQRNLRLTHANPRSYVGVLVLPETWPPAAENTTMHHEQKFQLILPMDPPGALQAERID